VTHAKASYYLRRIYKLLQDEDAIVRLRKFRGGLEGIAVSEAKYMAIDPRRSLGSTIIHEALHLLYPQYPDSKKDMKDGGNCSKWIWKTEEGICNALTERQWRNLYFRIGNKLY
jgi:hypothetical protein